MDDQQFNNKLLQFGELEPIESSDCGVRSTTKNEGLPKKFKQLHDRISACDACGLIATNRRLGYQKVPGFKGFCKVTCNHCKLCWNPTTNQFDIRPLNFYNKVKTFNKILEEK